MFSFVGYEYHLDSALVKPTQERWLNLQDLILRISQTCFDCKMFDVAIWVACLNGEDGPGGTPSHETLFSFISGNTGDFLCRWTPSFLGQKPFLHTYKSSSQDHSIHLFTDSSSEGWGAHSEQTSTKSMWSDKERRLHINVLELKAVSLALQGSRTSIKPNSVSYYRQLNNGSLHK